MACYSLTSLNIRNARPSEADHLADLALRSKAVWGYSEKFIEACRDELSVTRADMAKSDRHYFVAEINKEITGFYALVRLSNSAFVLEALFIEPSRLRKGIGRALMDHAKDLASSLGGRTLHIQSDPYAAPFYQAMGGKPTGTSESGSIPGRMLPTFDVKLIPK